jgi:hypothetical protein
MSSDYASLLETAARLAAQTADALKRGDLTEAERLRIEADAAWQRAQRAGRGAAKRPTLSKAPSGRERAIAAVAELGVPSSPRLIAAYAHARTGEPFDLRVIASIRRDEYRSWTSMSRRESYLVPALEGPWFAAARGRFALSHWPLALRIVGPLSPRADHLRVCLRLLDRIEAEDPASEAAARVRKLLVEYARTVPGALGTGWQSPEEIDTTRVRAAVTAELALIEVEDTASREQEAERATRSLTEAQQLWGGSMPQIVPNKSA